MDRRSFLSALTLSAAAIAVDPEMLGWRKAKSIFVPPAPKDGLSIRFVRSFDSRHARFITRMDTGIVFFTKDGLRESNGLQSFPLTDNKF